MPAKHVRDFSFGLYFRVNQRQMIDAGDRFRQTLIRIIFCEHRLALQVGLFNEITVNDSQAADACASERFGLRRPQRAAADDDGARVEQPTLPRFADTVEKYLPAVTLKHRKISDFKSQIQDVIIELQFLIEVEVVSYQSGGKPPFLT